MELLSPPGTLGFGGTVTLLSAEAVPFCIPSAMREGSDSPASSPSLVVIFLVITLPGGVKWPLIVTLSCVSVMTNDVELLFMCSLAISLILFGERCIQILCPFKKNWVICPSVVVIALLRG